MKYTIYGSYEYFDNTSSDLSINLSQDQITESTNLPSDQIVTVGSTESTNLPSDQIAASGSTDLTNQVNSSKLANQLETTLNNYNSRLDKDVSLVLHYSFEADTAIYDDTTSIGFFYNLVDKTKCYGFMGSNFSNKANRNFINSMYYKIGTSSLELKSETKDILFVAPNVDGSGIQVESAPIKLTETGITVCFWIKSNTHGLETYLDMYTKSKNSFNIKANDTFLLFNCHSNETDNNKIYNEVEVNTLISKIRWRHITWVIKSDLTWEIYVNGLLMGIFKNQYYEYQDIDYLFFGITSGSNNLSSVNGYYDDFRIYTKVLSQLEINELVLKGNTEQT